MQILFRFPLLAHTKHKRRYYVYSFNASNINDSVITVDIFIHGNTSSSIKVSLLVGVKESNISFHCIKVVLSLGCVV